MQEVPPLQKKYIPRVYLAGKVGKNNFRFSLGLKARDMSKINILCHHKRRPFVYRGPIIPSCDHGCWHYFFSGGTGYDTGYIQDGSNDISVDQNTYTAIVGSTISQIQASDFLFAWLDSYDAYATLAEIGIAVGSNIPVYIGFREDVFPQECGEPPLDWSMTKDQLVGKELWYIAELANQRFITKTASEAFTRALKNFAHGQQIPEWKAFVEKSCGIVYPRKS